MPPTATDRLPYHGAHLDHVIDAVQILAQYGHIAGDTIYDGNYVELTIRTERAGFIGTGNALLVTTRQAERERCEAAGRLWPAITLLDDYEEPGSIANEFVNAETARISAPNQLGLPTDSGHPTPQTDSMISTPQTTGTALQTSSSSAPPPQPAGPQSRILAAPKREFERFHVGPVNESARENIKQAFTILNSLGFIEDGFDTNHWRGNNDWNGRRVTVECTPTSRTVCTHAAHWKLKRLAVYARPEEVERLQESVRLWGRIDVEMAMQAVEDSG